MKTRAAKESEQINVLRQVLRACTAPVRASDLRKRAAEDQGLDIPKAIIRRLLTADENHTVGIPGVIVTEHPQDTFWYQAETAEVVRFAPRNAPGRVTDGRRKPGSLEDLFLGDDNG